MVSMLSFGSAAWAGVASAAVVNEVVVSAAVVNAAVDAVAASANEMASDFAAAMVRFMSRLWLRAADFA
jgi:outer membrane murein-binding lipoprotein Lpp